MWGFLLYAERWMQNASEGVRMKIVQRRVRW